MKYNIEKLIERYETGDSLEYLFFWGHSGVKKEVGKQCLSQWYKSPFEFEGNKYQSTEHWMMAQKALLFNDQESLEKILSCTSPKEAKILGRKVINFGPDIWNQHKFDIVVHGNIHKFTQNPDLFDFLKATADKVIIEASPDDKVWGIGVAENSEDIDNIYLWEGQNLLGFALMEVRDRLNKMDYFKLLENTLLPPWKKYPNMECSDLFWRMGKGEDYIMEFYKWWDALSTTDKEIFKITFPKPEGWQI